MLQSVEQGPKKSAEENEKNKNITLRLHGLSEFNTRKNSSDEIACLYKRVG